MRSRFLYILPVLLLWGQCIFAQVTEVRRCTENEIPMDARREYINQASMYLQTYYNQLLLNVNEMMVQQVFIQNHMDAESVRYKPEFMLQLDENSVHLRPDQYLLQLNKEFGTFDTEKLELEVTNVTIDNHDFYLPNLISCYVIAEYDLILLQEGKQLYKRRCRAYCLFPRVSVSIMVRLMQVEPVNDLVAYQIPKSNKDKRTVTFVDKESEMETEWKRANTLYDNKQYSEAVTIYQKLMNQGYAKAFNSMGLCYNYGHGVKKDLQKANELYVQSANKGYVRGMTNIGNNYQNGEGVEVDLTKAAEWYCKAAEQGDSIGQNNLGICHEYGMGVAQDLKKAVALYRKSAEQGYYGGQINLGSCYASGKGVPQDSIEAERLYKLATVSGNPKAQAMLGTIYLIDEKYTKAFCWYEKAASQNHGPGFEGLAYCYEYGLGTEQNLQKAFEYNKKSADFGDKESQNKVGEFYYRGTGVSQNYMEAVNYFRAAAEQGYADAQINLGSCYINRLGVENDDKQAFYWFEQAAQQNNSVGISNLGFCYEYGRGVNQDYSKAMENYLKAAEMGCTYSMCSIGSLFQNGKGVPKDNIKAQEWYLKAAEKNYPRAQYLLALILLADGEDVSSAALWFERASQNGYVDAYAYIGMCYLNGLGIEKDFKKAYEWYKKSAEANNVDGQYSMGGIYENGIYVVKDIKKARYWYKLAAEQGDEDAVKALKRLDSTGNTPATTKK